MSQQPAPALGLTIFSCEKKFPLQSVQTLYVIRLFCSAHFLQIKPVFASISFFIQKIESKFMLQINIIYSLNW